MRIICTSAVTVRKSTAHSRDIAIYLSEYIIEVSFEEFCRS